MSNDDHLPYWYRAMQAQRVARLEREAAAHESNDDKTEEA